MMSKDLPTFSTLQTMTMSDSETLPVGEKFVSGNDEVVASQLADFYQKQGIDPRAAYDSPVDAIDDFGGLDAFR